MKVGIKHKDFSVTFGLASTPRIGHFIAREEEIPEIHRILGGNGSRRTIVLYSLGGIGKTQLYIEYAVRYKDKYSAIF
jgi:hypothetical protein